MFSNLDRPIGNIIFNGQDLGVMNRYGTTGLVTGVRIPFGVQTLIWMLDGPQGMPRNGEHVAMKNRLGDHAGANPAWDQICGSSYLS